MTQRIEDWLESNTHRSEEFADISKLLALKKEQGLTISLGLPTKNVEESLAPVLSVAQSLQKDYPLLDQIAVIDSHSTDGTIEIVKKAGVELFYEDEILVEEGVKKGKGEALWKSLAVLKGDIILWIDSDIKNIHPRFIYGLAGPLLKNPDIQFVKAYYKRPIKVGESLNKTGGGRVTELVVRPLFNLFYPQLTGFVQPLSGEYGGRRKLLESVPFYTGYAVETGLLVEIERRFGLNAMVQVDLEERIHENQSTVALGKMSFAIMQAFFEMLEVDKKINLKETLPEDFFNIDCSNSLCHRSADRIRVDKRPPIKETDSYDR